MSERIFPAVIDNTMRKELVKCETAAKYRFEMGLEAKELTRTDLVAGMAYAHGLEIMRKSFYDDDESAKQAIGRGVAAVMSKYGTFVPDKSTTKTMQRMAGAVAFYAQEFPMDGETIQPIKLDGKSAIEVQFQEELPIMHPASGKPLIYAGRFDMLALDGQGKAWVVDDKTTSQMGDKWSNQWFLDSQITGYCWGARKMLDKAGFTHVEVAGAYINGIAIRKYDYEAVRLPVYREQWEVDRWYAQLLQNVSQWIAAFKFETHNQALDHACAFYNNPCQFAPLCKSRNPERLIGGSYVVRRWNPVERD
jgi:hypothetical protein